MRGFSSRRIPAVLVVALVFSFWAQTDVALAQAATEKLVVKEVPPVKVEKKAVKEIVQPLISKEVKESVINELRRELLDQRADYIDRWLAVVAIFLTFFGIIVAILGIIGFRRFQGIEKEARESTGAAKKHVDEAKKLVEEIVEFRDQVKDIRDETAETAANEPERVKQVAEDVRENPQAPLTIQAIADALSLQQVEKFDEAVEKWLAIAKVAEGHDNDLAARAWFSVGYLHSLQKKHGEAIDAYSKSIALNPNVAVTYNNRGAARNELGLYEDASNDCNQAINIDSVYAPAYINRGVAKSALGQYESAIADYDNAIHLDSNLTNAFNNRGIVMGKLDRYEEAISDYDKAISLKPDNAEAYNNRGVAQMNLSRFEAAITDYREALNLGFDKTKAYFNLGEAQAKLGQKDEARRDLKTSLQLARAADNQKVISQVELELNKLDEQ